MGHGKGYVRVFTLLLHLENQNARTKLSRALCRPRVTTMDHKKSKRDYRSNMGAGHHASPALCNTVEKRRPNLGRYPSTWSRWVYAVSPSLCLKIAHEQSWALCSLGFPLSTHHPHLAKIMWKPTAWQHSTSVCTFVTCGPWDLEGAELRVPVSHPRRKQSKLGWQCLPLNSHKRSWEMTDSHRRIWVPYMWEYRGHSRCLGLWGQHDLLSRLFSLQSMPWTSKHKQENNILGLVTLLSLMSVMWMWQAPSGSSWTIHMTLLSIKNRHSGPRDRISF